MEEKYAQDRQRFQRDSQAQLEQQERRLQNQTEAKLNMMAMETEKQTGIIQAKFRTMERTLQCHANAQQAEMQRLRNKVNSLPGM